MTPDDPDDPPGPDCATQPGICEVGTLCVDGACVVSECGDGIVDPATGESCDDANDVDDDGCTACSADCSAASECDDGDPCSGAETCEGSCQAGTPLAPGTGCSSAATPAGVCRDYGATAVCVGATCGDGAVNGAERCDDGNTTPGDGCEIDCRFSCESNSNLTNTWYADCDGDGYVAVGAQTAQSCLQPPPPACGGQWILAGTDPGAADCDDACVECNPGAAEICDGKDNDCNASADETDSCNIGCDWSSARWLSHGWDGGNAFNTGAWLSCVGGRVSYIQYQENAGTGTNAVPSGTGDFNVGCNWTGNTWASQGIDGAAAFIHGATVACDGSRVTGLNWEANLVTEQAAQPGQLGCNWDGAIYLSHGWDGGCAFQTGYNITCSNGRITHFEWVEGCARAR